MVLGVVGIIGAVVVPGVVSRLIVVTGIVVVSRIFEFSSVLIVSDSVPLLYDSSTLICDVLGSGIEV